MTISTFGCQSATQFRTSLKTERQYHTCSINSPSPSSPFSLSVQIRRQKCLRTLLISNSTSQYHAQFVQYNSEPFPLFVFVSLQFKSPLMSLTFQSLTNPSITPLQRSKSTCFPGDRTGFSFNCSDSSSSLIFNLGYAKRIESVIGGGIRALTDFREGGGLIQGLESDSPVSVELEEILNEPQFDRVLADAQLIDESLVILWMANWCRKCIFLKPKLEKLAAAYYPRIRFYCIDVNNVPHKLVTRAGVTKMPTIQLWKDRKKQAEVIGSHKAYLVVSEVREMIENEDPNV